MRVAAGANIIISGEDKSHIKGLRLGEFLDHYRRQPFVLGQHDCCTFITAAVKACGGDDLMADWPAYETRRQAAVTLRAEGGGTLLETMRLRMKEIPVAMARPWDIVALDRTSLGVCVGRLSAFVGEDGLVFRETLSCLAGFRASPHKAS